MSVSVACASVARQALRLTRVHTEYELGVYGHQWFVLDGGGHAGGITRIRWRVMQRSRGPGFAGAAQ
jgi:hypothetical protein